MKKIQAIILISTSLFLAGCVQKQYIKSYNGPDLSHSQVSLVKPQPGIIIESIDGDKSKKLTVTGIFGSTDAEIALHPGAHSFELRFTETNLSGTAYSMGSTTITVNLVGGRRYLLKAETSYMKWKPVLVDVTDKPELWCLNIANNCW